MRLAPLVCAVLAACGELPNGISIQVVPVEGVTSVELFIGDRCSGRCPGTVRPPMFTRDLPSELYQVANDGVWTATLEDGVAGFRLINDGADEATVHVLVAVGYNASREAIATAVLDDVKISPTTSELYEVKLAPATPIVEGEVPAAGSYRIKQWQTSNALLPSCVVVEQADVRIALGPDGDTDCDEVKLEPECAPWTYLARGVPGTIASASCVARVAQYEGTAQEACLAASPLCDEVVGSDLSTCTRLTDDYCLTHTLCECAATSGWDPACLLARASPTLGETSYVECTVGVKTATEACANPTLFESTPLLRLLGYSASSCDNVKLNELGSTIGPFDTSANFPSSTGLVIKAFTQSDCAIVLEWKGVPSPTPHVAMLALDLSNDKFMVVPLIVHYDDVCDTTPTCVVHALNGDRARLCAEPPSPSPGECTPAGICEGPECGGVCCGAGERCGPDNVCMCGTSAAQCNGAACGLGLIGNCGSQCCSTDGSDPPCEL